MKFEFHDNTFVLDFADVQTTTVTQLPSYDGPYEVIPTTKGERLDTKGLAMSDDLKVLPIPSYEVSNETGVTFIIR